MKDEIKEFIEFRTDEDGTYFYYNDKDNIEQWSYKLDELKDYITNLQEEIERLNNIITELEKRIKENIEELEELETQLQQKENIIKEVREYITSYESIETIQQSDHNKNNKDLDYSTINEITRRYMIVHDKILELLNKGE